MFCFNLGSIFRKAILQLMGIQPCVCLGNRQLETGEGGDAKTYLLIGVFATFHTIETHVLFVL